ncbi:MAG: TetR/AcrR family transcriptional regulator [Deltaproteobacteria bacterium]|nr:TetR/AcrR family transcriptional regulator [Deltaproteobacteria bacterium]
MAKVSRKQILQDFRSRSLLESTRRLIAAEGFDAVTMARVAEEAGITKGAIYLYFRNKDQMILAAIEEIAAEMVRGIERRVDPRAEPWDRLCQLIRAQLAIMEENKELLRTLLLDRRLMKGGSRSAAARRLLKYRQKHEADIRAVLEKGVRRRLFHPVEVARAAFYINELTISTAQRRLLALTRSSLEQETEGLIRFVGLLLRNKNFNKGH